MSQLGCPPRSRRAGPSWSRCDQLRVSGQQQRGACRPVRGDLPADARPRDAPADRWGHRQRPARCGDAPDDWVELRERDVNKFTALAPLTVRQPSSARRPPETSGAVAGGLRRAALLAGATASDDGGAGLLVLTPDETVELANTRPAVSWRSCPPAADGEPTFRPLSAPSPAGHGAASTMTWTASPPGTSPCPGLPQRSRRAECRTRGGGEFGRRRGRALL